MERTKEEIATQWVTLGSDMKQKYDKLKIEFIEYKIANDISRFFEDVRSEESNEILGGKIREAIQGNISISHLKESFGISLIVPFSVSKHEIRYRFNSIESIFNSILPEYKDFKNFVRLGNAIIHEVIDRMEETWTHVRKQRDNEMKWYCSIYDKSKITNFFGTKPKLVRNDKLLREVIKQIKQRDLAIKYQYKELEKYQVKPDTTTELKLLYDLVTEIIYPKFLRELHEKSKV